MNEVEEEYIPGTCNIGKAETHRRVRNGYIGLVIAFVFFLFLEIFDLPRWYRIVVLPPVFYSLSGFIQARYRFCYLFGMYGVFSMSGKRELHRVKDNEALQKDKRTALKILAIVLVGSLFITGIYMVI
jgi:hypothetical protein